MTADAKALPIALDFTSADLDTNRQGLLSKAQMARLKAIRQRNTLIASALFLGLVLGATLLIYIGQLNRSVILFGAGAILTLINAIVIGRAGQAYMRVGSDLRLGQVEMLAGELERVLRRGRAGDNYLLRINGAEIHVRKAVFIGFRHQALYRIYRTPHSRLLLSAEPSC